MKSVVLTLWISFLIGMMLFTLGIVDFGVNVSVAEGAEGDRYVVTNYEPVLVVAIMKQLDFGTTRYDWTAWDKDLTSTWVRWSTPTYATVTSAQNAWLTWRQRHRPGVAYQYVYPHRIRQNSTERSGDTSYTSFYETVEGLAIP
jgi:hypothetical protein